MKISNKAVDYIISAEVISPDYYEKHFSHPIWPKGESGITIGIGYDLGYNSKDEIALDWAALPPTDLTILQTVAGIRGDKCVAVLPDVKSVDIPFSVAKDVFTKSSLSKYAASALKIYPGLDKLLPDAIGGIVSMVYNRGASIIGTRRVQMKNIVPLVAAMDYSGIAAQIEASKILWQGKGLDGLLTRRDKEASLVRSAIHGYADGDSIEI